ncbi:hypothetical protein BD779DRAFT_1454107 [Infundibulicybe gibba]|nr:hypothetical protein BD779DRAFT_1454107 [Infundibulicybe gibba]
MTGAQLQEAHSFFIQFVEEFENIYYERHIDRLHTLLHTSSEVVRRGPGAYLTQFPMERAIGFLGQGVSQPSNPFGNLMVVTVRRSQENAVKAIFPELDSSNTGIPKFAEDVHQEKNTCLHSSM